MLRVAEPAAVEAAEFWGAFHAQHKVAPPANANARDAFTAASSACGWPAPGTSRASGTAKVDFAVAPVPRLLKQPVVWTIPHQYVFPKPKALDAAKRDAA